MLKILHKYLIKDVIKIIKSYTSEFDYELIETINIEKKWKRYTKHPYYRIFLSHCFIENNLLYILFNQYMPGFCGTIKYDGAQYKIGIINMINFKFITIINTKLQRGVRSFAKLGNRFIFLYDINNQQHKKIVN